MATEIVTYTAMNGKRNEQFLLSKLIAMAEVDIDDSDSDSDNDVNMTLTSSKVVDDDIVLYASRIEMSKDANDIQRIIEALQ